MTVAYAIHDLGGIACPASAACSSEELAFQLKSSNSMALFVSPSLPKRLMKNTDMFEIRPVSLC